MEYEIIDDSIEIETSEDNKYTELLKEYKDLDIQIKELKLKQDKLKIEIFSLMDDDKLKKCTSQFATASYSERFEYDKKKAVEYFLENDKDALEVEYKVNPIVETKIKLGEYNFDNKKKLIKSIRTK